MPFARSAAWSAEPTTAVTTSTGPPRRHADGDPVLQQFGNRLVDAGCLGSDREHGPRRREFRISLCERLCSGDLIGPRGHGAQQPADEEARLSPVGRRQLCSDRDGHGSADERRRRPRAAASPERAPPAEAHAVAPFVDPPCLKRPIRPRVYGMVASLTVGPPSGTFDPWASGGPIGDTVPHAHEVLCRGSSSDVRRCGARCSRSARCSSLGAPAQHGPRRPDPRRWRTPGAGRPSDRILHRHLHLAVRGRHPLRAAEAGIVQGL